MDTKVRQLAEHLLRTGIEDLTQREQRVLNRIAKRVQPITVRWIRHRVRPERQQLGTGRVRKAWSDSSAFVAWQCHARVPTASSAFPYSH
jgi:hypothetical protein